jgi:hypothetical protein
MLKNLEMTLESYMSDSQSSNDDKSPERSRPSVRDSEIVSPVSKDGKKKKEKKEKKEKKDKKDKDSKEEKKKKKKKKNRTAEEIYYDSLNGGGATPVEMPGEGEGAVVSDEDVEMENGETGALVKQRSDKFLTEGASRRKKSTPIVSHDESMNSGGTVTQETSIHSGSDMQMSITEIKNYVLQNLSKDVKEMIPEEAWGQIFNDVEVEVSKSGHSQTAGSTNTGASGMLTDPKMRAPPPKKVDYEEQTTSDGVTIDFEMDDSSVVSEITTHTMAVRREDDQRKEFHQSLEEAYLSQQTMLSPHSRSKPTSSKKRFSGYASAWTPPLPLEPMEAVMETPQALLREVSDRSVQFSTVSVRYFKRILDVNPSVTSGPAIGLGWIYRNGKAMTVDQWESSREYSVRESGDLVIPRQEREMMLAQLGYTQQDIAQAVREIRKAKDMRRTTVENLKVQNIEEKMENATTMVRNLLRIGKRRGIVK